jgi:hypothetical protein
MTDFIVTITDQAQLAGITWAREKYNAALPPPPPPPPPPEEPGAMEAAANGDAAPELREEPAAPVQQTLDTDDAYVQWVMEQAAASYAVQQEQEAWIEAYREAQTASGRSGPITPPSFVR